MRGIAKKYPIRTGAEIEQLLQEKPQYRDMLFAKGYLLTDDLSVDPKEYPFFGLWKVRSLGSHLLLVHPQETFFILEQEKFVLILVGHAYNPFTMVADENLLLEDAAVAQNKGSVFETVSHWTGAFVLLILQGEEILALNDASGLKMCNYSTEGGCAYISSHPQLIADLLKLSMSKSAAKLRTTKMYNVGMRWMPGLSTPYREIWRLGPNLCLRLQDGVAQMERFYPCKAHRELSSQEEMDENLSEIHEIMRNNLLLTIEKWQRPALSLTGGMDSRAALACTAGFTDRFEIFSFDCKEQERLDSAAAKNICDSLGVSHVQYHVPDTNRDLPDYDVQKTLVDHSTSYVMNLSDEEMRKIIYLRQAIHFDVEAKSDAAEIGRVFYERKYGMPMPQVFHPRHLSVIQTRYFFMPRLLKQADRLYADYLEQTGIQNPIANYEHSDLLYWEYRIGAAAAFSTLSLDTAMLLTFPYNNRILFEKFLEFPHDLRKDDYPQRKLMERYMPQTARKEVGVEDKYFGKLRILLEKVFFRYKTAFR